MGETLYIQTEKQVQIHEAAIRLKDVAQLACSDSHILSSCQNLIVAHVKPDRAGRYVMDMTDIIIEIQKKYPNLDITHMGEPTFLVTYTKEEHTHKLYRLLKIGLISFVTFFGTAFSIMTFNNDVDVGTLFSQLYEQLTGDSPQGFTILHASYSLGLGIGILFFFNHFGRRKMTQDPTPMQVQMRLYEDNVNITLTQQQERKEKQSCGSRQ